MGRNAGFRNRLQGSDLRREGLQAAPHRTALPACTVFGDPAMTRVAVMLIASFPRSGLLSDVDDGDRISEAPEWAGPGWSRLEQQIRWYDRESRRASARYKAIKVLQLLAAAAVPVVAGLGVSAWVTGSIGSAIVVMEGIQQLSRDHEYWISYRATCEALRQEMWLFEARAGIYRGADEPDTLVAERLHEITSQESARWVAIVSEAKQAPKS